jgi:hypothetical protein
MDLNASLDILKNLDNPIIMVIGKRKILAKDTSAIVTFGRHLAERLPRATFRTGNAPGADRLFMQGISEVDASRLTLFIPFDSHAKPKQDIEILSLEQLDLEKEPQIVASARTNPKTGHHVDPYLNGKRDRFTMKISYIFRDVWMVLGSESLPNQKADAVFYYDDLESPLEGGTGFTVKLAMRHQILCRNQRHWMAPC